MGQVRVKAGVEFGADFAFGGARILEVLKQLAPAYDFDITITSARDGVHSGPSDPHHTGEAFDIRTQGLQKAQTARLLNDLRAALYHTPRRFYAFLEAPGTTNEHIHVQRRASTTYTALDYLSNA